MNVYENLKSYDFEIFKALVEIEIERIKRYKKSDKFSIAFLYFPSLSQLVENNSFKEIPPFFFKIKENIRSADVISPVDDDFVFLFLPETSKEEARNVVNRIKSRLNIDLIEGIASFPTDGDDARELFDALVKIMNDKLLPVIKI